MSQNSRDLGELEDELFAADDNGVDTYAKEVREKTERKLIVSNFLESKEQSRISRFGGQMLSASGKGEDQGDIAGSQGLSMLGFRENFLKLVMPAAATMFCGTFTYPIAVRVARRVFGLRGFYAIHISIAPFLALIHVNIFGTLHALGRVRAMEHDYDRLAPSLRKSSNSVSSFKQLRKLINQAKEHQADTTNTHCARVSSELQMKKRPAGNYRFADEDCDVYKAVSDYSS